MFFGEGAVNTISRTQVDTNASMILTYTNKPHTLRGDYTHRPGHSRAWLDNERPLFDDAYVSIREGKGQATVSTLVNVHPCYIDSRRLP